MLPPQGARVPPLVEELICCPVQPKKKKKSVFIPQPQSYGAEELRGWVGFLLKLRTSCGRMFIRLRVTTPSSGKIKKFH